MKKYNKLGLFGISFALLVSCNQVNTSIKKENSEALIQIGTEFMKESLESSKKNVFKAMTPTEISKPLMGYVGTFVYFAGLLEKHESFECSTNIIKFEHNIKYEGCATQNLGMALNLICDRENNEIIFRGTQGNGQEDFCALLAMKIDYDFSSKTIGDYFYVLATLEDNTYSKVVGGTCYSMENDVFKTGQYEDAKDIADELINPFIDMIPNATAISKDLSKVYFLDYASANDYYNSIGGGLTKLEVLD